MNHALQRQTPQPVPDGLSFRNPLTEDAAAIFELVKLCEPLETNSAYVYMLLCQHFRSTCLVVRSGDRVVGFISCYYPPRTPDVLFVWQIAVHPEWRRQGLGLAMLEYTLEHHAGSGTGFVEATVSPDNFASQHLFAAFARRLSVPHETSLWLRGDLFDSAGHPDEHLHRIGPLVKPVEAPAC